MITHGADSEIGNVSTRQAVLNFYATSKTYTYCTSWDNMKHGVKTGECKI